MQIRHELLTAMAEVGAASTGLFYSFVQDGNELRCPETQGVGDDGFRQFIRAFDGVSYARMGSADPHIPDYEKVFVGDPAYVTDGFCLITQNMLRGTQTHDQFWVPQNITSALGMVVVHQARILGWVGVFRRQGEKIFVPADRKRIQPHFKMVTARVVLASQRAEALFSPHEMVAEFDATGAVTTLSRAMKQWLDVPTNQTALQQQVTAFAATDEPEARGLTGRASVHLTRMRCMDSAVGTAGCGAHSERVLARLTLTTHPLMPIGPRLTPAQRPVADLAVAGATVPEIARALGKSPETVRVQMRDIYHRLGLASRVELVKLWAANPRHDGPAGQQLAGLVSFPSRPRNPFGLWTHRPRLSTD